MEALKDAIRSIFVRKPGTGLSLSDEREQRGSVSPEPTREVVVVTPAEPSLSRQWVLDALREDIDPELGHNIVDLGLIYGLEVKEGIVKVAMTMTTPGCPAQDYILSGVYECCRRLPGLAGVSVDVVWDPPWSPHKMSATARAQSGIGT